MPSGTNLERLLAEGGPVLAEGSVVERVRRGWPDLLDPLLMNASMIYSREGREVLHAIYAGYLDAGRSARLPMLLLAPTWRANVERLAGSPLAGKDVNGDAVRFMEALRGQAGAYADRVLIGGLLGCRGDAYKPSEALSQHEARAFHVGQARSLAAAGVDFLLAATLPELGEAIGMADAMAATGAPYVMSFVLRPSGTLLDGMPLDEAVARIDGQSAPPPLGYMANCVHPSALASALSTPTGQRALATGRFLGLQANTSALSPEELDGLANLDSESPSAFAEGMVGLRERFGLRLLGGCCGTDDRHIAALAGALATPPGA